MKNLEFIALPLVMAELRLNKIMRWKHKSSNYWPRRALPSAKIFGGR